MNQEILYVISSFVVSMVCGMICIPTIIDFCVKKKLYDLPNGRKIHKCGVPRLGGVCFLPSMFLALLFAMVAFNNISMIDHVVEMSTWSCTFFVSLMLIFVVGFLDDLLGLGAWTKFLVQTLAAVLLPVSGLYINNLYGLFGVYEIPYLVGAPFTVLVIVFINNAINLIDGIDGLAGGLSLLALAGFLFCFAKIGLWAYCILIAGLMGVLVSFLYFNVFGKPENHRKVFMGDTGSLTLGFILAFLLVKYSMDNPVVIPYRSDSLLFSCTLLIVPVFDVFRVVLVRLAHRRPLFDADKNHIHHKLMRAGLGQHGALLAILGLALFYVFFNFVVSNWLSFTFVLLFDIVIWLFFHCMVNVSIKKQGKEPFCNPIDAAA